MFIEAELTPGVSVDATGIEGDGLVRLLLLVGDAGAQAQGLGREVALGVLGTRHNLAPSVALEHPVDGLQTEIAHPLVVVVRVDQGDRQPTTPWLGGRSRFLLLSLAVCLDQVA